MVGACVRVAEGECTRTEQRWHISSEMSSHKACPATHRTIYNPPAWVSLSMAPLSPTWRPRNTIQYNTCVCNKRGPNVWTCCFQTSRSLGYSSTRALLRPWRPLVTRDWTRGGGEARWRAHRFGGKAICMSTMPSRAPALAVTIQLGPCWKDTSNGYSTVGRGGRDHAVDRRKPPCIAPCRRRPCKGMPRRVACDLVPRHACTQALPALRSPTKRRASW
jgi:hypothetical protein